MMKSRLDNPFMEDRMAIMYDKFSRDYHRYEESASSLDLLIQPRCKILEIGVGTGVFTEILLSRGYQVRGIDVSEKMLDKASEEVQSISEVCELLEHNPERKYDIVLSHSGGFTFKQGRFESYYQRERDLRLAFEKIYEILESDGKFLVNKGEHDKVTKLGKDFELDIKRAKKEGSVNYTYSFIGDDEEIVEKQRRIALNDQKLEELSLPYFRWNFREKGWIIGEKNNE